MTIPVVAVLAGGTSSEREVSLGSGLACAMGLSRSFPTRLFEVNAAAIPEGLDPAVHVVFSTLHGTFGEDGGMQTLLDQAGIQYAGCDAASSALTMDKTLTKSTVAARGVAIIPGLLFERDQRPSAERIVAELGEDLVLKPNAEGSSVGLNIIEKREQLEQVLGSLTVGRWMVEKRIRGKELSVGVLNGEALGVVEIRPKSGVYDYTSKYTKGLTEYFAPAEIGAEATAAAKRAAEISFAACACRDYARVDFLLSAKDELFFLEINTLPGMKETSLLPMSARCVGLDFSALVREMILPARNRFFPSVPSSATL